MTIKELIAVLSQCDPMMAVFVGREIDGPDKFSKLLTTQTGAWEIGDDAGLFTFWTDSDLEYEFGLGEAETMRRQNPAIVLIGEDL